MITNPNIFTAKLDDIPELVLLINKAYRGEGSKEAWTSERYLFDGLRINENVLTGLLRDEKAIILKYINDNGAIIGCVYLQKQESQIYLGLLSVLPDMQAAGVGKQLLIAAEEFAQEQNCHKIVMTVITIRHELVKWYERAGIIQQVHNHFRMTRLTFPISNWSYLYWRKKFK
jgi:ribosomal protein S18 acetylase RimI-like enzyme